MRDRLALLSWYCLFLGVKWTFFSARSLEKSKRRFFFIWFSFDCMQSIYWHENQKQKRNGIILFRKLGICVWYGNLEKDKIHGVAKFYWQNLGDDRTDENNGNFSQTDIQKCSVSEINVLKKNDFFLSAKQL